MTLGPGSRLGSYEILAKLGEGGMGEVYKARDPRLNRLIAIKILSSNVAHDQERRERFQREAQAIAALNQPNIVTIYSVEDADGTAFLTMELVEGKTLSELLPKNGWPLARVLKIGIDVVDALVAAHSKGITHRDLKPANIMIGSGEQDGRVKVLDFGLAKLDDSAAGSAKTEIATALVTGEGRILGTVAYMSPEQAEGKPVDARSDLFSTGIVLYEMATGRRPFIGDSSMSILSSIMRDTPASIAEINPSQPRELARIIRRALQKDPEARYQTAKDLRNDLRELRASLESGDLALQTGAPAAPAQPRAFRLWQAAAIVAGLAAIVAIALLLRHGLSAPPASAPPQAPIEMTRLTSGIMAARPAISPDGKFVAYVQTAADGQDSIWVRQVAATSNVQIVPPEPSVRIFCLTVTPDDAFVDFLRWPATDRLPALWRVPLLGGPARRILDDVTSATAWSPDGKQMAFLTQTPQGTERSLALADADGGRIRIVATRKLPQRYPSITLSVRRDVRPVWLPDGRSVVLRTSDEQQVNAAHLVKVDTATGAETPIAEQGGATLLDAGLSLALGPDQASVLIELGREAGGTPQIARVGLADGVVSWLTSDLDTYFGISRAGNSLVASREEVRKRFWAGDGAGRELQPVGSEIVSDEGDKTIAWIGRDRIVYSAPLAGGIGVWTTDLKSGVAQLIMPGPQSRVLATADGRTVVYNRVQEIWRAESDGTHPSRVATGAGAVAAITRDGSVAFYVSGQSGLQTAWALDLKTGATRPIADVRVEADGVAVSPDGRWIALATGATGRETIVEPIGGGPQKHLPPLTSGSIQWTPDGKALASIDSARMNVWIQPIDGSAGHALTHFTDETLFAFGWSADGQRLVVSRGTSSSDIVLLKGIR